MISHLCGSLIPAIFNESHLHLSHGMDGEVEESLYASCIAFQKWKWKKSG